MGLYLKCKCEETSQAVLYAYRHAGQKSSLFTNIVVQNSQNMH